jgi:hypothetical protein
MNKRRRRSRGRRKGHSSLKMDWTKRRRRGG